MVVHKGKWHEKAKKAYMRKHGLTKNDIENNNENKSKKDNIVNIDTKIDNNDKNDEDVASSLSKEKEDGTLEYGENNNESEEQTIIKSKKNLGSNSWRYQKETNEDSDEDKEIFEIDYSKLKFPKHENENNFKDDVYAFEEDKKNKKPIQYIDKNELQIYQNIEKIAKEDSNLRTKILEKFQKTKPPPNFVKGNNEKTKTRQEDFDYDDIDTFLQDLNINNSTSTKKNKDVLNRSRNNNSTFIINKNSNEENGNKNAIDSLEDTNDEDQKWLDDLLAN